MKSIYINYLELLEEKGKKTEHNTIVAKVPIYCMSNLKGTIKHLKEVGIDCSLDETTDFLVLEMKEG